MLGRMAVQDKLDGTDCVYLANLAISAIQTGYTTREVETVLRKMRMAAKASMRKPDGEAFYCALGNAVDILRRMGGIA